MKQWMKNMGLEMDDSGQVTMKLNFHAAPPNVEFAESQMVDRDAYQEKDSEDLGGDVEDGDQREESPVMAHLDKDSTGGSSQDSEETMDPTSSENYGDRDRSQILLANKETNDSNQSQSQSQSQSNTQKTVPTEHLPTQSPRRSPRKHQYATSNIRNFSTSASTESRNSRSDDNPSISLPPKKLDYTSALPFEPEAEPESQSQSQVAFEIRVEDDSSDEDTQEGNGSPKNDLSLPVSTSMSTMRHVTPGTDRKNDAKGKKQIPIRNISNRLQVNQSKLSFGQMAPMPVKEERVSPPKRTSPSSWLETGKETSKKAKRPPQSSSARTANARPVTSASSTKTANARNNTITSASSKPKEGYKYQEVVRGKKAREKLHGYNCECCSGFYDALCAGKGSEHFDREKLIQQNSRHRARDSPPQTPVDFWEMSFVDEIREREEAVVDEIRAREEAEAKEEEVSQEASQHEDTHIEQSIAY